MPEISRERARKLISSPYAWGVLALLMLIYILSFVDRQIVAVLATRIQAELSLSNLEVGYLYGTAFSFVYAFSGIPMGRLADVYSRKWLIAGGLLVWSLATMASGFAGSLAFLVGARMMVGVSESMLSPAVYSLLSDYFRPAQRATVFSLYSSSIFIGIGLSFLVGGSVAEAYDWRTAMIAVGAPGLLVAVAAFFLIRELPRGITQEHVSNEEPLPLMHVIRYILRKKTVILHHIGFSFLAFTGYTVLSFFGTVLVKMHNAAELIPHVGWFMMLTGGSVILSGKIADYLARENPERRFIMGIVAGVGGLPLYYFGLFAGSGLSALLLMGSAVVISSSYNGVAAALVQYLVKPNMRALAGGIYLFVISVVGFGIGPPLTGYLMDNVFTGPQGPAQSLMLVITICGIMGSVCFLAAMKTYAADAEAD